MDIISMMAAAGVIYFVIFSNNFNAPPATEYCVDCGSPSRPGEDRCESCIAEDFAW